LYFTINVHYLERKFLKLANFCSNFCSTFPTVSLASLTILVDLLAGIGGGLDTPGGLLTEFSVYVGGDVVVYGGGGKYGSVAGMLLSEDLYDRGGREGGSLVVSVLLLLT